MTVVTIVAAVLFPPAASTQEATEAEGTRAARGLGWGAAVGGALGALSFGVLSVGLCDAADCDGSFLEGFFPGLLVGATGGGLTGLVIGSAIPDGGRAVGGWSVAARAGLGGIRNADVSSFGPAAELSFLRSITATTAFGVTVEYMGDSERRSSFTIRGRDQEVIQRTERRRLHIGGVRLVAARTLAPGRGPYVVGLVGVHPTVERLDFSDDQGPFASPYRSFVLAPGGGIGAGLLRPIGERWALDVEARGDVIVGVGSGGLVPGLYLTAGLRRR